jgi:hypothetical protein
VKSTVGKTSTEMSACSGGAATGVAVAAVEQPAASTATASAAVVQPWGCWG